MKLGPISNCIRQITYNNEWKELNIINDRVIQKVRGLSDVWRVGTKGLSMKMPQSPSSCIFCEFQSSSEQRPAHSSDHGLIASSPMTIDIVDYKSYHTDLQDPVPVQRPQSSSSTIRSMATWYILRDVCWSVRRT